MTPTAARRGSIAAIGIGLLAAGTSIAQATGTAATQPLTAQTQVRANSAGAVQIGMTVKQAEHATGQRFVGPAGQPAAAHPSGCSYIRARQAPRSLSFMLSGTPIVRVDIAAPDATTSTTGEHGAVPRAAAAATHCAHATDRLAWSEIEIRDEEVRPALASCMAVTSNARRRLD